MPSWLNPGSGRSRQARAKAGAGPALTDRNIAPGWYVCVCRRLLHTGLVAVLFVFTGSGSWVHATSLDLGGGTRVDVPLQSFKDLRDKNVVRQAYDYSCGAATLATLMTYAFDDPIGELEVIEGMLDQLDQSEEDLRKKEGFSLLDMQRYAQARGYKAQGFRLDPQYLPDLVGPTIVFVRPRGYDHFVVLKGVRGDRVYVADPSLGNVRMPLYAFLDSWLDEDGTGIVFVVEPQGTTPITESLLSVTDGDLARPEILGVRQLLDVGLPAQTLGGTSP